MPTLKIDIHIHTNHSDSRSSIQEVVQTAKEKGLDGIAITDHMKLVGFNEMTEQNDQFLIIPGVEVETKDGHVLVLGVRRAPGRNLSLPEVVEWGRSQGAATVIAHPEVPGFRAAEAMVRLARPDAIETLNALVPLERHNHKSSELAESLGLPQTGGSDSHRAETVGDAYTLVDVENRTVADVVKAIREGRIRPGGRRSRFVQRLLSLMGGWFRVGGPREVGSAFF